MADNALDLWITNNKKLKLKIAVSLNVDRQLYPLATTRAAAAAHHAAKDRALRCVRAPSRFKSL
ncbi:MAG TPA: hypothetical protein VGO49_11365 [Bradyrhizobium sp.]|jgi:hypothetical protein|nr:hypothetical protein [Bradyrhizobium sp.]